MSEPPQPTEEDDRPWEQPGAVRRDCDPHRGPLLAILGAVSLTIGGLFACIPATSLIALPLAIVTYSLARRDLAQMRAGRMDPAGIWQTRRAQARAGFALGFSGFNLLLTAGLALRLWLK
jgi:hypothetical protein